MSPVRSRVVVHSPKVEVTRDTPVGTPTGTVCCPLTAVPLSREAIRQDVAPDRNPGTGSLAWQAKEERQRKMEMGIDGVLYCWYCDAIHSPSPDCGKVARGDQEMAERGVVALGERLGSPRTVMWPAKVLVLPWLVWPVSVLTVDDDCGCVRQPPTPVSVFWFHH